MGQEQNWLKGICDYDGPASDLPAGGYSKIPNWFPESLAQYWIVLAPEIDAGVANKKTEELKKGDIIIGVHMNPNSIQHIVDTYGREFYKITDANDHMLTLDQWQARYHTNGLGLVAIRNIRKKL